MKIRLALTLDLHRDRDHGADARADDAPAIYDVSGSSIERAERQPIGFTGNPVRVEPDEWDDRR